MSRIRVAVADDSAFIRQAVARMLSGESGIVLAGLASSGEELLDHLDAWRPDVIILDLSMPGLGGLATLDTVMARRPTPVLILSTHSRQDAPQTIEALHRGALDFIDKQQYSLLDFERLRGALLEKIRLLTRRPSGAGVGAGAGGAASAASAVSASSVAPAANGSAGAPSGAAAAGGGGAVHAGAAVGAHADGGGGGGGGIAAEEAELAALGAAAAGSAVHGANGTAGRPAAPELLLLGASTGGPPAIEAILRQLGGRPVPVPIVVVQHMPAGFTRSFADRLNAGLPLPVREVTDDEPLVAGTVYVAPGGTHLRLARVRGGLRAALSPFPETSTHRPSIDLLFGSAAAAARGRVLAVILTGMGHDGAAGVAALARSGAYVLAQDEASAAVHGMPRAAVATGGVREVLPLDRIGDRLGELLSAFCGGTGGAAGGGGGGGET